MSGDVAASVGFFSTLGFVPRFQDDADAPRYAAVVRDSVELHLQWHEDAGSGVAGDRPVYRILVDDVDAVYEEFTARGVALAAAHATPWFRPADTAWGTREFHLRDPDRNGLQFYQLAATFTREATPGDGDASRG